MDKSVRKYSTLEEMKADGLLYWQSRPAHERIAAVSELTTAAYGMKGIEVRGFERIVVRVSRPKR